MSLCKRIPVRWDGVEVKDPDWLTGLLELLHAPIQRLDRGMVEMSGIAIKQVEALI
jgi:hypothetical protein